MTTRSGEWYVVRPAVLAVIATLLGAACTEQEPFEAPGPRARPSLVQIDDGATVTAVIDLGDGRATADVAGIEGWLEFDPTTMRYRGQELHDPSIMMIGERELDRGRIRFVVFSHTGLAARSAVLGFERTRPNANPGLSLTISQAGDADAKSVGSLRGRYASRIGAGLPARDVRRMTLTDWYVHLGARHEPLPGGLFPLPGQGTIYGDVNLNSVVNVFDALAAANVAAGNQPLLTDASRDLPVAGDVHPANAPGLGEWDDPIPPGLEPDGSRNINVFDVLGIQNAATGAPQPVAGRLIPGRAPTSNRQVLNGQILADRTLARDTVYELDGMVIVTNSAVLSIPAGTRIEGNSATRGSLSIRRGARLEALGTRLEPIIMTCTDAVKAPGCWGGLQINGSAPVNNGNVGSGGGIQCPDLTAPGGFGIYGGCFTQSSSGALRYVRIEYGGAPAGATPIAGLQLLGVGSGTLLEDVQVHRSFGDGLYISGGTSQLRQFMLTDNGGIALDWDNGWTGRTQQLVIHRGSHPGIGVRGSNAPPGVTVFGQRSMPIMYQVTLLGATSPGSGSPGVSLYQGTGGMIRDLIVQGFDGPGLDINDVETCSAITGGQLVVRDALFFQSNPDFSTDSDCIDEVAYGQDPMNFITVADPLLLAPNFAALPDIRPAPGSPAAAGTFPPADGFLDPNISYLGAVPLATVTRSNVPWYAGWTVGWQ